ncbi:hypothetical protein FJ444_17155 [Aestuariibacter sp. GS-14]|uniref:PD40 domain-containing protein n=1 Tax=Aestuariibacter sp. GS-14 TaxID=2590670 RepID=UPI001128D10A|nr:PD40 domain-containing protein [Aestuariibacter sp. GS-14]TPV55427.1 hypothetical protein FJ444_17155 [Aestuariibacter sp. GS-14]
MLRKHVTPLLIGAVLCVALAPDRVLAQIGDTFASERKVITDPVTGVNIAFLTSQPAGDSKIYPTHPQWTADGNWLVFRSNRVPGEAMAVNEQDGTLVQVSEGGYFGMLVNAQRSNKLYLMRDATFAADAQPRYGNSENDKQIVEVNTGALLADVMAKRVKPASHYQRVVGIVPGSMGAGGDMALDAAEDIIYFRIGREEAARYLPKGTKPESNFGPRNMGAGPTGIASMDLTTGKIAMVVALPFQLGHIQTNPWVSRELIFCWETGGKSPQRMWTMKVGGEVKPLYPEADYEWVTHEAVITRDEVAFAIMGHRDVGTHDDWGPSASRLKPTGLGIVNLRTNEMRIAGQTRSGSGLWHVHGSPDGRWAVGDDFERNLYLIDRTTDEMILLSAGHKTTAKDHTHPTFSRDGTKIQIQSAMLSDDDRSLNIAVIYIPESLLNKDYSQVKRLD